MPWRRNLRANTPIAADQSAGLHPLDGRDRRPRSAHRAKHLPGAAPSRRANRVRALWARIAFTVSFYTSRPGLDVNSPLRRHSGTPAQARVYDPVAMSSWPGTRRLAAFLAVALLCVFSFTACGGASKPQTTVSPASTTSKSVAPAMTLRSRAWESPMRWIRSRPQRGAAQHQQQRPARRAGQPALIVRRVARVPAATAATGRAWPLPWSARAAASSCSSPRTCDLTWYARFVASAPRRSMCRRPRGAAGNSH